MQKNKLVGQKWQKLDVISVMNLYAAFWIGDRIAARIVTLFFELDGQQLTSFTVPLVEYVAPTLIFGLVMFQLIFGRWVCLIAILKKSILSFDGNYFVVADNGN